MIEKNLKKNIYIYMYASLVAWWKRTCLPVQEMWVRSLGWEDPLEKETDNPLQYSCLGNPMDREVWWAIVYRVTRMGTI